MTFFCVGVSRVFCTCFVVEDGVAWRFFQKNVLVYGYFFGEKIFFGGGVKKIRNKRFSRRGVCVYSRVLSRVTRVADVFCE